MKRRININGLVYVATIILIYGSIVLFKAYQSRRWPTSAGVVISSEVTKSTRRSGGENRSSFHPSVHYEYTVGDNVYSSSRISFGPRNGDLAQQIVDYYHTGKHVEVFYNPQNPANSVLENKVSLVTCAPLIVGSLIAVLGIFFTYKSANGKGREW